MPHGFSLRVGDKGPYSFTWTGSLADGETIEDSDWTADPALGLTLTADDTSGMTTTVVVEAVTAGSYILTNRVTGSEDTAVFDDLFFSVAPETTTAYLTEQEAELRLWDKYRIEADLTPGDVEAASDELDAKGPFIGYKLDTSGAQARAFPRNLNPDWTVNTEEDVPERILNWVALKSYQLTSNEGPGIISESIGMASWTFSNPAPSQTEKRLEYLLKPYLDRGANTTTVGSSFDTWMYDEDYPGSARWGLPLP